MRIAFITFEYPPFILGGSGIYAENITQELAKLGHQIEVFTPGTDELEEVNVSNNLKIKRIGTNKNLPFKGVQFWLRLPKIIKEAENIGEFDVIHFSGSTFYLFRKRLSKAPHIIRVPHLVKDAVGRNNPNLYLRIRHIQSENGLLNPFIEQRFLKCADRIISVSNYTKNKLIEIYGIPSNQINVVYNGICSNRSPPLEEELMEIRKQLDLPEKPVILFVGRIDDPRKNLKLLLRAFAIVLKNYDASLVVIGSGRSIELKRLIESLGIAKNVYLTGFVDESFLKKCYSLCDIYVCPSNLEGFGITILEAFIAGKPVIATEVGAIPEFMKDGKNGILISDNNLKELSEAIMHFLENQEMAKEIGAYNRRYVLENFSWTESARETIEIYEDVLSS